MGHFSGSDIMKLQIKQWSERPRILLLMLAVILPAAALIGFSLHHLWLIEHDKAIEAAIQKDYERILAIAEKQIDGRAYEIAEDAIAKFPAADSPDDLDGFLNSHP